ncbi:MAG TPA: hypothetical protein VIP11_08245 [Gemmatimonadaceae bacterium]
MKLSLLVAGLAALAGTLPAVRRADRPMLFSVAAAEAEGRSFPREAPPTRVRPSFSTPKMGTVERKCVSTSGLSPSPTSTMRAGDFVAWGQLNSFVSGQQSKVGWGTLHDPAEGGYSLVIRAARIGNTSDTVRYTRSDYGYSANGLPKVDAFYPTRLQLTRPGVWILVATSGPDWGCLIVNVTNGGDITPLDAGPRLERLDQRATPAKRPPR